MRLVSYDADNHNLQPCFNNIKMIKKKLVVFTAEGDHSFQFTKVDCRMPHSTHFFNSGPRHGSGSQTCAEGYTCWSTHVTGKYVLFKHLAMKEFITFKSLLINLQVIFMRP